MEFTTQPITTTSEATTETTTVVRNNQRGFAFVIGLLINVTEDLTINTQYLRVMAKVEVAVSLFHRVENWS
jgi:outer membrane protein W